MAHSTAPLLEQAPARHCLLGTSIPGCAREDLASCARTSISCHRDTPALRAPFPAPRPTHPPILRSIPTLTESFSSSWPMEPQYSPRPALRFYKFGQNRTLGEVFVVVAYNQEAIPFLSASSLISLPTHIAP